MLQSALSKSKIIIAVFIALLIVVTFQVYSITSVSAQTTGNGSLVYKPTSSSFDGAGATYSRIICLKNSGSTYNGQLLCTFDQLKNVTVTVNGQSVSKQVYPIYRSTDNGSSWTLVTNVYDTTYGLNRTSQPVLYEVPQTVGSLSAGTLLLAGNIFDDNPATVSRIVIWKSTDHGSTWSFLSQVDSGGPCVYDPSASSTTTTVWEPYLGLDSSGNLVCYYSDERQKASGILQAVVCRRSTNGGSTWGSLINVTAVANTNDRPGMITVSKMGNGKYIATYEVVNKPSTSQNTAPVYYKFSDDGVTWTASDLGTQVKLANGRGIGSSPYVKWVPAGGPNGMVIIASKWGLDSSNNISGAQDFYVNYNYGKGNWERMPMAVTCDGVDSVAYFAGFEQSIDTSVDGLTLYHASNVENSSNTITIGGNSYLMNDVRVGTLPLNVYRYEAEKATMTNCSVGSVLDGSNGQEVQYINYSNSSINFTKIKVPSAGTYVINVRYSNGSGSTSAHSVKVNNGTASTLSYPATFDWNRFGWVTMSKTLNAGANTISFTFSSGYTEIDCIEIFKASTESNDHFKLVNRTSSKYLEVLNASTSAGAAVDQWGNTNHLCQNWYLVKTGSYFKIVNLNSLLYLDITGNSTSDGAAAIQQSSSSNNSQQWTLTATDSGYFHIINRNSNKLLEIYGNSSTDGAIADQYSDTGYNCQDWTFVKEGIE